MSGSELGPWPPRVTGLVSMSFQVLTVDVCQVTQVLMSSVTLPSQANLVPSNVAPLSSSGLMPVVREKVPNDGAVLGRALNR